MHIFVSRCFVYSFFLGVTALAPKAFCLVPMTTQNYVWKCVGSVSQDAAPALYAEFLYRLKVEYHFNEENIVKETINLGEITLYDHYGPEPVSVIDLRSSYICPNSGDIITTRSEKVHLINNYYDFLSPFKWKVMQGCGDGLGVLEVTGFCRHSP